jgi:hypothetical protein
MPPVFDGHLLDLSRGEKWWSARGRGERRRRREQKDTEARAEERGLTPDGVCSNVDERQTEWY